MIPRGLADKIYWRPMSQWRWCAFVRGVRGGPRYVSLCGRSHRSRSGGQECARPPAMLRCVGCDLEELDRRGWEESGAELPEWRSHAGSKKSSDSA